MNCVVFIKNSLERHTTILRIQTNGNKSLKMATVCIYLKVKCKFNAAKYKHKVKFALCVELIIKTLYCGHFKEL